MQIFLLLDHDTALLEVSPVAGQGSKPVNLVEIGHFPLEVKQAFDGASIAAHNCLMNHAEFVSSSFFSYEVLEEGITRRINGTSGSLAFTIALMHEMLGKESTLRIGATGVVSTAKGTVKRIEAINDKLKTLIAKQTDISVIYYPAVNDREIVNELRQQIQARNINLKPVKTLDDVYHDLFGEDQIKCRDADKNKNRIRIIGCAAILAVVYISYVLVAHALALFLLENEHYTLVKWHLHIANSLAFYNSTIKKDLNDFQNPLKPQFVFTLKLSSGREETYPIDKIPPVFRLTDLDTFAFRFDPSEPLYIYIVQSEESRFLKTLYPSDNQPNPIIGPRKVPVGAYFCLQGKAGSKDIYAVVSRWRCKSLEKKLASYGRDFHFPEDMDRYLLEEQSVQLKKISISFEK